MPKMKNQIMDEATVRRTLMRMAHEISEKNRGVQDLCLVGILRRGYPMAQILAENLKKIEGAEIPVGFVDIKLYRDDLTEMNEVPVTRPHDLGFSVVGKKIVLVDDVLFTGRTVRAAIEAVFALGRPREIQLAVLVDRGHRQLPFRPDYVGKNIPTSLKERVGVFLPPVDEETKVCLFEVE